MVTRMQAPSTISMDHRWMPPPLGASAARGWAGGARVAACVVAVASSAACGGTEEDALPVVEDQHAALSLPASSLKLSANPTLPNVAAAFQQIPTQGTRMGFRSGPLTAGGGIYGSSVSHWEGVGRLASGSHLVATSNINGELWLVQLASLTGPGRWPSNRPTGGAPPAGDTIIRLADGSPNLRVGYGAYTHAGGLSVIGDYVVVGVEREGDSSTDSVVRLYDVSAPDRPRSVWGFSHAPSSAGAIAIVRLPEGYYLLAVGGWGSATVDFYLSTTTDLENPGFRYLRRWTTVECRNSVAGDAPEDCFNEHQNLNFVLQSDGRLYLFGTNRSSSGDDWVDMYEVTGLPHSPADSLAGLTITKVANKHLYCNDGCTFKAAAGVYVDGSRLVVYATEMRRRSGDASTGPWTRFNQF